MRRMQSVPARPPYSALLTLYREAQIEMFRRAHWVHSLHQVYYTMHILAAKADGPAQEATTTR